MPGTVNAPAMIDKEPGRAISRPPKSARDEEARQVVQEYADDQRGIIARLRSALANRLS